jgi:transaldolase
MDPFVPSVASLFVSRWDAAVAKSAPEALRGQLGIAIAKRTYRRTASCSARTAGCGC